MRRTPIRRSCSRSLAPASAAVVGLAPIISAASPAPPRPSRRPDRRTQTRSMARPSTTTAACFSPEAVKQAELIIDAIEGQTKAEVAVYTQAPRPRRHRPSTAEAHARALMDQWGVGRQGIDDGLVLLVDLDTSREHGQVRLFGGSGFLSRYADTTSSRRIIDDTFLPRRADGQFDAALLVDARPARRGDDRRRDGRHGPGRPPGAVTSQARRSPTPNRPRRLRLRGHLLARHHRQGRGDDRRDRGADRRRGRRLHPAASTTA